MNKKNIIIIIAVVFVVGLGVFFWSSQQTKIAEQEAQLAEQQKMLEEIQVKLEEQEQILSEKEAVVSEQETLIAEKEEEVEQIKKFENLSDTEKVFSNRDNVMIDENDNYTFTKEYLDACRTLYFFSTSTDEEITAFLNKDVSKGIIQKTFEDPSNFETKMTDPLMATWFGDAYGKLDSELTEEEKAAIRESMENADSSASQPNQTADADKPIVSSDAPDHLKSEEQKRLESLGMVFADPNDHRSEWDLSNADKLHIQ